VRRTR